MQKKLWKITDAFIFKKNRIFVSCEEKIWLGWNYSIPPKGRSLIEWFKKKRKHPPLLYITYLFYILQILNVECKTVIKSSEFLTSI